MKSGSETPLSFLSKVASTNSSKPKLSTIGRTRKNKEKYLTSTLLRQRQDLRVIENDIDLTPKPLTHPMFSTLEERQITAFETIGLSQSESTVQLMLYSSGSNISSVGRSSSVIKTSSFPLITLQSDDMQVESLLSTQIREESLQLDEEDKAPSQFYLPSIDPNVFYVRPESVTITLKETQTFFIFEMLPLMADIHSPEGIMIKEQNENYEYLTVGPGANRKFVNAETQTIQVLTKSQGTYLARKERNNQSALVNNWVVYDTYAAPELMTEANGRLVVRNADSIQRMLASQETQYKLPKDLRKRSLVPVDEALHILNCSAFWDAVRVMERIIENNVFIDVQKRFTGLIKKDPCSLDLEFTYTLDLLWTHVSESSRGRPVSSFRWNYVNKSVIAVAYGAQANSGTKDGLLLIWCAKNPSAADREYSFSSPISDIDWSRERPNLLAVGFYNGEIKVLDVSSRKVNAIRQSQKVTSPSSSPQWQVQWWPGDEQFEYQEQIYTSDNEGHVYWYRSGEDFISATILKIFRIEGKIPGVDRTDHCNVYDVPMNRNPGALVLRKHPSSSIFYFVGSDEGCIYKCSINYLMQHLDSFLAHDGPIYSIQFSPFCTKIFLTCGADWCTRIWAEGLTEPLITLFTTMECVRCAAWSPTNSTILVSIVNNKICVWDIKRKTYMPTSVTTSPHKARYVMVEFTSDGNQLAVADTEGVLYIYNLEGVPFPPYNQQEILIESIEKALITKPALLKKLKKLGPPFSESNPKQN